MQTYKTAEVAKLIGIHPNTVRLYEQWGFIPQAQRQKNGYRIFTDFHVAQLKLARLALQIEVLQNGLRKQIVEMVKVSATGNFDKAIELTQQYLLRVQQEQQNAEEAIKIVRQLLSGKWQDSTRTMKRKEVSDYLGISMDTLRNWEMNGLLTVKRQKNGYRIYTEEDICYLKIIRSLRCANYSLEAILRMLRAQSIHSDTNIKTVLNTPAKDTDLISVCDQLFISLQGAEQNAYTLLDMLCEMKRQFT